MFLFVKISIWHCFEIKDIKSEMENIQGHLEKDSVVFLCNDKKRFTEEFGIDLNTVNIVV